MRPPKVDMVNQDLGKQQKVAIIHQVSRLSQVWVLHLWLIMLLWRSRTGSNGWKANPEASALVGQQMLAAGAKVSLWLRLGTPIDSITADVSRSLETVSSPT